MGGIGSGGGTNKTRADSTLSLNIRSLYRHGALKENQIAFQRWYFKGEPFGTLGMTRNGTSLILAYTTVQGDIDQEIILEPIPCHFGGHRFYFQCPNCAKRSGVLYLTSSLFLCGQCSNVVYDVKNETKYDKLLRRSRKLRRQLGAEERPFGKIDSDNGVEVCKLMELEKEILNFLSDRMSHNSKLL